MVSTDISFDRFLTCYCVVSHRMLKLWIRNFTNILHVSSNSLDSDSD